VRLAGGGLPSRQIEVTLELHGMLEGRAYTDGRGKFTFEGLGANTYTLIVREADFEPVRQSVRVMSSQGGAPVVAVITLRPLGGGGAEMAPAVDPLEGLDKKTRKEFEAGVKEAEKGNAEKAIKHYRKVLETEPEFYPAYNNLGYQYIVLQKLPEAERAFQEALKRTDSDAGPCFGLGNVYVMTGKPDQAEEVLRMGLERDPNSAFGHYLLGAVYAQAQKYPQAETDLRKALELDPNLSLAQMTLVNVYLQQQRDREALAELTTFVERFPQHSMIGQAQEMKKQLEGWIQSQPSP
jgi:tetratricopeptide (TPR) repeat protein